MLADTTQLFGVEALLRWQHPVHGLDLPRALHPDRRAERPDRADRRVGAREACRQAAEWRAAGHTDFVMAVNLSPRQLSSPKLASVVATALRDNGLPPSALCLEITESAIMEDPEAAHAHPPGPQGARRAAGDRRLRRRLLLALAPQVPAARRRDQDRQVVRRRARRVRRRRAIIAAIISARPRARRAARSPRASRTQRRSAALRELGCHVAQGYHFSKPAAAGLLADLSHSESLSAASPALSPALQTPSPASLKIVWNLSA